MMQKDWLYDFYGFEKELYQFEYDIKSDKKLTLKIMEHLERNGLEIEME